jgi:uncharacterized membrane protein YtjA (UPF0391 family)
VTGTASLGIFLGLALVFANLWVRDRQALTDLGDLKIDTGAWKTVLLELGGVMVAGFIAGSSPNAAKLVLAFFVILWVLFLINTHKPATTNEAPASKPNLRLVS